MLISNICVNPCFSVNPLFVCILGSTVVIETGISAAREYRNDFSFGSQPLKRTLGESFISILTKAL